MVPRVTLVVFLSFWCLSHQQGRDLTLCRGNRSVLARCGAGSTPFPGQLPPGWSMTCQTGTTTCVLTSQITVESTQYYNKWRCDSETWNLNYLCLPANQSVDMCQGVRQTREGNTSLVHGQLMASRGDNVACTCVVTRAPDQAHSGVLILLYTRYLVQPPVAEAAPCQGKLTLRDSVNPGPTLCLLTTRPTGQDSNEASLYPGYSPYLNETKALTITYELDGGDTRGQDQLLPFALRLSGTGSYDIECWRLDHDVTKSAGNTVPTTTTIHTNRKFESTSIENPSSTNSAAGSGDGGEGPQINGITIGLSVALALVVLLVIVIGVFCLLRRRRLTPGKPSPAEEDHQKSMNLERQTQTLALTTHTFVERATQTANNSNVQEPSLSANNVSGVGFQDDGRDVTMDTSGLYETVRDRDPALQHCAVHQSKGQGGDGPDRDYLEPVTMNQPTRHQSSTELPDNHLYGSTVNPESMARQGDGMGQRGNYGNKAHQSSTDLVLQDNALYGSLVHPESMA